MSSPQSEPVRLLVIGAGRMGQVHLDAIAHSDRVQAVAVVDPDPTTPERLAASGLAVYTELDSAIAAGGFDAALIAAPSGLHRRLVDTLMDHHVPTLCEKPCGLTSDDAQHAADRAAAAGAPLQIGYWRRFVPELRALRDDIDAGLLGEIVHIQAWQWDGEPPAAGFRAGSGGPLLDMGVHEFDMIRWLTGQDLTLRTVVECDINTVEPVPGDPESLLATGKLDAGGVAVISLGRRFDRGDCCWLDVIGTLGSRRCEYMTDEAGLDVFRAALVEQLNSFAAMVAGGQPSQAASPSDAVAALRAVEIGTSMYSNTQSRSE